MNQIYYLMWNITKLDFEINEISFYQIYKHIIGTNIGLSSLKL